MIILFLKILFGYCLGCWIYSLYTFLKLVYEREIKMEEFKIIWRKELGFILLSPIIIPLFKIIVGSRKE